MTVQGDFGLIVAGACFIGFLLTLAWNGASRNRRRRQQQRVNERLLKRNEKVGFTWRL